MKKVSLMLAALSLIGFSSLVFAGKDSLITFAPVTVSHNAEGVLDLTKGSPSGIPYDSNYTLICHTSANAGAALLIGTCGSIYCVHWTGITVNDTPRNAQFQLPANAVVKIDGVGFGEFGNLNITNLDNQTDVTLNCTATPVF